MSSIRDFSGHDEPRHQLLDEDSQLLPDGYHDIRPDAHGVQPTDEELQQQVVAPGEPHFVSIGVTYQGEWREHADGLSKAVREQVQALAMYVPVNLEHVHSGGFLSHDLHPDVARDVGYLPGVMFRRTAVAIRQIVFQSTDFLRRIILPASGRILDPELVERILKSTIVYTSWERNSVSDQLILNLQDVGELWVPCEANWRAFVTSGLDEGRVKVVPHTYNPATHPTTQIPWPRGSERVPSGRRFYNIGKWEPRKNQHGLIGAFLKAFTPKDRVSLLVKTHGWGFWDDYPNPEESLEHWIKDPEVLANGWDEHRVQRLLRIVVDRLSDEEIADLHRENNIYVSASHGEAWDMPAFDALCAGNSLVHVGYGGTEDYAELVSEFCTVVQVPHTMGPVHDGYNWEPEAQWAVYEEEDLVSSLRAAKTPVRRVHPPKFSRFSRVHVGRLMRERIVERLREVGSEGVVSELAEAGSFG